MSDLTFIDEGNSDKVNGLINFSKREMIYNVVADIAMYQQMPFDIQQQEPLNTFTYELPALDEDSLWRLSQEREPRGSTFHELT